MSKGVSVYVRYEVYDNLYPAVKSRLSRKRNADRILRNEQPPNGNSNPNKHTHSDSQRSTQLPEDQPPYNYTKEQRNGRKPFLISRPDTSADLEQSGFRYEFDEDRS